MNITYRGRRTGFPFMIVPAGATPLGAGTLYPIGLTRSELAEWFWRIKDLQVTAAISYSIEWDDLLSFSYSGSVAAFDVTHLAESEQKVILLDNGHRNAEETSTTGTATTSGEIHDPDDPPDLTVEINLEIKLSIPRVGDLVLLESDGLFYPYIRVGCEALAREVADDSPYYFVGLTLDSAGGTDTGIDIDFLGKPVRMYYYRPPTLNPIDDTDGLSGLSLDITVEPANYWDY